MDGASIAIAAVAVAALVAAIVLFGDRQKARAAERAARAAAARESERRAEDRRELEGEVRRRQDAVERANELRSEDRRQSERHLRRLEEALAQERALLRRMTESWKAEREWSRELRAQLQRLQEHHGRASGDVRELVLEAAIRLVGAEKGLMLARHDSDHDGRLDLVASQGFENDPERSVVVQRFAHEVLERDEIVRDDDPPTPAGATPADREIDALVAIPVYLRDRFSGVIVCANRPGGFGEVVEETLLALGDHAATALHHHRLHHELRDAHRSTVRVLAEAVAARDPLMHHETGQLALHASWLARELGMDDRERDVLVCATVLRTLGNLSLPEELIFKPGPLTDDERVFVQLHARLGFNIACQAPALHDVAVTLLYHHERYDGTGYPAGLAGTEIPPAARALAVLEAYGAMTNERPYRLPWTPERACEEIVTLAGSQFDPRIAALFVEHIRATPSFGKEAVESVLESLPLDPGATGQPRLDGLAASATDGLTLLGDHRALQHAAERAAADDQRYGLVLVQLMDLARVNDEAGYLAGDRLIQVAGRGMRRAAMRLGGSAFRQGGSRLAVLAPLRDGHDATGMLDEIRAEFSAGPAIRVAATVREPGESSATVLRRAREAIKHAES